MSALRRHEGDESLHCPHFSHRSFNRHRLRGVDHQPSSPDSPHPHLFEKSAQSLTVAPTPLATQQPEESVTPSEVLARERDST
jgi:hypothetical protein